MGNFVLNLQEVLSSFALLSLGENCLQCLGTPNLTNSFFNSGLGQSFNDGIHRHGFED